jgi:thiamine transport system permease protein
MRRPAGRWLLLVPAAFLGLMLLAPVTRLVLEGAAGEATLSAWSVWSDAYLRWRLLWSAWQAAATGALALLLGLPLAWILARWSFPGRTLMLRVLMLPFVVPTLVAALGVLALWGPRGVLGAALAAHGIDLRDTPWLLLYGNLFFNLSLVVRAGTEALAHTNAAQVAAARTLGATPWRAFWRVEWPAIRPWMMASLCLVFLYCFSGFGLALVLGGERYATAEVEIYRLVAHELALADASVLALWMLVLTAGVALAYAWAERRLAAPARTWPLPRRRPRGAWQWLALVAGVGVWLAVCAAPLLAIAWRSAAALADGGSAVLADPETRRALVNTLRFSGAALVLATTLGVCHALGVHALDRWRTGRGVAVAGGRALAWRALQYLPFVVSPVMVAFGLLLLFPQWTASLGLLVGAYALLAYPFVARTLTAALDALPTSLAQAAATLGASPVRVLWRVVLPLVRPALRRGMAFAAATALGEFAVSLFLSRPEWTTLTTLIYQRLGRPGAANLDAALLLSGVLMLLALAAFVFIEGREPRRAEAGDA